MKFREKSTIGIITVNNDTFTNPTLFTLIRQLDADGHQVVLYNRKSQNVHPSSIRNIRYFDGPQGIRLPKNPVNLVNYFLSYWKIAQSLKKEKITHLIAVDPNGLILAGRLKRLFRSIRIHYFSFEIFFSSETRKEPLYKTIKKLEIKYSQKLQSILVQDEVRKQLLIQENKIAPDFNSWHLVPVAPEPVRLSNKAQHRRLDFGVKETDLFYIYSGSIASWAGIEELMEAIKNGLPADTYLLIHNKAPFDLQQPLHRQLFDLQQQHPNLILHGAVFDEYDDYLEFLTLFDYGIVIYKPDDGIFTGQNIKEIGLASGKFSCYMAMGLPCLLYQCTTYSKIVQQYAVGAIISEAQDLSYHFRNRTLNHTSKVACLQFYSEVLDPTAGIRLFIERELFHTLSD